MSILNTLLGDGEIVPQPGNFDPITMVPLTDEQVKYALSQRPDNLGCSMWGHYCCDRQLGKSVLNAWITVLNLSIGNRMTPTV